MYPVNKSIGSEIELGEELTMKHVIFIAFIFLSVGQFCFSDSIDSENIEEKNPITFAVVANHSLASATIAWGGGMFASTLSSELFYLNNGSLSAVSPLGIQRMFGYGFIAISGALNIALNNSESLMVRFMPSLFAGLAIVTTFITEAVYDDDDYRMSNLITISIPALLSAFLPLF
jgi:hypothetical protein